MQKVGRRMARLALKGEEAGGETWGDTWLAAVFRKIQQTTF